MRTEKSSSYHMSAEHILEAHVWVGRPSSTRCTTRGLAESILSSHFLAWRQSLGLRERCYRIEA